MEKKRMNKRGQPEGMGLGTVLAIIAGVVVLVILIIGFTKGFDFIFGKWDILPGQDLETVVKSCEFSAQQGFKADHCSTFKEVAIDGKKQFVNCEDERVKANMDINIENKVGACGLIGGNNPVKNYCTNNVKGTDLDKTLVNGKTCSEWGFTPAAGTSPAAPSLPA